MTTEGPLSEISGPYFSLAPAAIDIGHVDSLDGPDLRREVVIETLMVENRSKSETAQRVAWGRRFLAATVVVPPSISELLNTDTMPYLRSYETKLRRPGSVLFRWHGSRSAPMSAGRKCEPPSSSLSASK